MVECGGLSNVHCATAHRYGQHHWPKDPASATPHGDRNRKRNSERRRISGELKGRKEELIKLDTCCEYNYFYYHLVCMFSISLISHLLSASGYFNRYYVQICICEKFDNTAVRASLRKFLLPSSVAES